ncbi:unnamed protein product [Bursaphelenchus xylophilus]|uniref:Septin n=1 Tax=Bursaphelenchus xylophilus TaxID=6326 RepID=A0A1I7S6Z3_BURXY|nr:unnamed protein product [Bursaphelenchus xylophilus]CAG9079542.1 unnamed protein product [Bursaphelenchus xylophilus]
MKIDFYVTLQEYNCRKMAQVHRAVTLKPTVDAIGFSNFPNQVFRRCIKNGFDFTLMVVGQSGLGKSTFINSMFLAEINEPHSHKMTPEAFKTEKTVKIHAKTLELEEDGVHLNVTFVDTPGFGDFVDNKDCWDPIVKYIDDRFAEYLNEETRIERKAKIEDKRVHVLLYFIQPSRGLSQLDVLALKSLHDRVNIVPVIAKADTLTSEELTDLKKTLLEQFIEFEIKLYEFPAPYEYGNKSKKETDYRDRIPFAIVGSNQVKDNGRNKSRIRQYIWGTVEVDNLEHNDFLALRDILVNQNLMDLIDVTKEVHYENFRSRQMQKSPKGFVASEEDPFTRMEKDQRQKEAELQRAHATKERIFAEKVGDRLSRIQEEERKLNEHEKALANDLREKQLMFEVLQQQVLELRRQNGLNDSSSSHSPDGRKKKSSTLSLFR